MGNYDLDKVDARVTPVLICEVCTYNQSKVKMMWSWEDLIDHAKEHHWLYKGKASNGQSLYACQFCGDGVQFSSAPYVDFGGNLYCHSGCVRQAYEARLESSQMIHLLAQELRDEAYVRQSLGVRDD